MPYFLSFDTLKLPQERAQVVVCGSGIAGLTSAITLKELGLNPLVLTRGIGNTYYSQGGIACAVHPHDSTFLHILDTQRAGRGLCKEEALRILVDEGVQRIGDLERWGVRFDMRNGFYETTVEGGHSFPRVLKVKDYTGRAIYEALFKKVKELSVPVLMGELQEILFDEELHGILYYDGSLKLLRTKVLILATGGAASMFLHTSNPVKVRGDAIGMSLRTGVCLRNVEFVQFHPTVVEGTNLLISEAVRGEGAWLVDERGNRFINELQPRDVVSRAIYKKLKEGSRVFLDMRHLPKIEERFPTISQLLREKGLNPYKDLIPIVPAAHYFIGGVEVDSYGRTSLPGVYAVGECACSGVHGANRLASNSLLEGVVFGYRTAYRVYHDIKFFKEREVNFKSSRDELSKPPHSFEHIRKLMWKNCGLERSEEDLKDASEKISKWIKNWKEWEGSVENRELLDISLVALSTVKSALQRRESRGVHYRKDYPYEREELRRDSLMSFHNLTES